MLDSLPDAARLWLFALDRQPDDAVLANALADLQAWLPTWTSHGRPVQAEATALEGRVLAVGAAITPEEINAGVSGCGIDAMQHTVEAALEGHGLALAPALSVTFKAATEWQTLPRPAFRQLVREGKADGVTRVLDLTLGTVGTLRTHGLARPAAETWVARAFRLPVAG